MFPKWNKTLKGLISYIHRQSWRENVETNTKIKFPSVCSRRRRLGFRQQRSRCRGLVGNWKTFSRYRGGAGQGLFALALASLLIFKPRPKAAPWHRDPVCSHGNFWLCLAAPLPWNVDSWRAIRRDFHPPVARKRCLSHLARCSATTASNQSRGTGTIEHRATIDSEIAVHEPSVSVVLRCFSRVRFFLFFSFLFVDIRRREKNFHGILLVLRN